MKTLEEKIKHYNLLLKKLDKKIKSHIRKSPVMQSGGISNKYLYLTKRYENAEKKLNKTIKKMEAGE